MDLVYLQILRYTSQSDYLENLLNEVKFKFDIYNAKFLKEYYNDPIIKEQDIKQQQINQEKINQKINEIPDGEINPDPDPDEKMLNSLYRKLSLKTHPDKIKNGDDSIFKIVSHAYKTKNLLKLLKLACEYKIEIEECPTILLEKNIKDLEKEINDIQHSVAWIWVNEATDEQKEIIKKNHSL